MNIYIVYKINLWPFTVGNNFELENSVFVAVKLTANADADKNKCCGYCIRSDARG